MLSIGWVGSLLRQGGADRSVFYRRQKSAAGNVIPLFATVATALALGACAQGPTAISKTEFRGAAPHSAVAANTKKHRPSGTSGPSYGIASFYAEGSETASGEKFDPNELTAAHPTLPFGTRLRVTNVATGRSVTVRVNDRGPFVAGRAIDVSYSAAEKLGIVDQGLARVKVDVVQ